MATDHTNPPGPGDAADGASGGRASGTEGGPERGAVEDSGGESEDLSGTGGSRAASERGREDWPEGDIPVVIPERRRRPGRWGGWRPWLYLLLGLAAVGGLLFLATIQGWIAFPFPGF